MVGDIAKIVFKLRLPRISSVMTCPVGTESLTEETLTKLPRIVTNILHALITNCDHSQRGCTELIKLVRLEAHSHTCKYTPVTFPNEKCAKIMNLADLEQHTSEVCEYRQVYCEECEKDMSFKKCSKHSCVISKDVHAMKESSIQMQDQVKRMSKAQKEMSKTQKEILEAIKNPTGNASGISTAKVKASLTLDARPQGSIVVVGGLHVGVVGINKRLNSVEM